MPKSVETCNKLLALLLNAVTWTGVAQNAGSPLTNLYLSLHTASPVGNDQTSNEANYGSYVRIPVVRTTSGWTVPASGASSNVALAQFAECTSGSNVITDVAIGSDVSGVGNIFYKGTLAAARTITSGIQPQFAANALTVQET